MSKMIKLKDMNGNIHAFQPSDVIAASTDWENKDGEWRLCVMLTGNVRSSMPFPNKHEAILAHQTVCDLVNGGQS